MLVLTISDHGIIFCLEDNFNKSVIQVMLGEGTQGEESSSPAEGSKFLLGDRNSSKYKDEAGGCTRTWRGSEGGGSFQGEATAAAKAQRQEKEDLRDWQVAPSS